MKTESYLNHPTFGLLYRLCALDGNQEIFTTLYAQRLFFLVTTTSDQISFETITRSQARISIDNRLRSLRRNGISQEYQDILEMYKKSF
jgi:PII interaction protein X